MSAIGAAVIGWPLAGLWLPAHWALLCALAFTVGTTIGIRIGDGVLEAMLVLATASLVIGMIFGLIQIVAPERLEGSGDPDRHEAFIDEIQARVHFSATMTVIPLSIGYAAGSLAAGLLVRSKPDPTENRINSRDR